MSDRPDVLIVGAGFAGMYAIYRFRQQGLEPLALEAGPTWAAPGTGTAIPAPAATSEPGVLLRLLARSSAGMGLAGGVLRPAGDPALRQPRRRPLRPPPRHRLGTRVTAVGALRRGGRRWRLTTETGDTLRAPVLRHGDGLPLGAAHARRSRAPAPSRAPCCHTGRWPKEEPDFTGKRVGIIGTGSSGVQAIPDHRQQARHLTVFQRTPEYSVPANEGQLDAVQDEFKANTADPREQQNNPGGVSGFRPLKTRRSSGPAGSAPPM